MARHWRMLLVPDSSKCDVDRDRPVTTRNVLEHANLPLEGYFRALYAPLGGSRTRMENTASKSMKLYISMSRDKPPCMPLCFGTVEITLPKAIGAFSSFFAPATAAVYLLASAAAGFCSFLASAATAFSSFLASEAATFSSCLAFFFLFFCFHFPFFFFDFFFFLRLCFQPG